MNHAIEILKKHKAALEVNLKDIPGMIVSPTRVMECKDQLKDVKKAIVLLEVNEKGKIKWG